MATPYKYRVRCTVSHTVDIPADNMVDQRGNVLCAVPARSFSYAAGHESGFRTKAARDAFLKANAGKWEAV